MKTRNNTHTLHSPRDTHTHTHFISLGTHTYVHICGHSTDNERDKTCRWRSSTSSSFSRIRCVSVSRWKSPYRPRRQAGTTQSGAFMPKKHTAYRVSQAQHERGGVRLHGTHTHTHKRRRETHSSHNHTKGTMHVQTVVFTPLHPRCVVRSPWPPNGHPATGACCALAPAPTSAHRAPSSEHPAEEGAAAKHTHRYVGVGEESPFMQPTNREATKEQTCRVA